MEWSERMNAAVDYIEENLANEIDFSKAAEKAACSTFHFQRIFFAVNGLTPAEYARRRRLTQAARELTSSDTKVIDIALKYGYESPDAFTRAFRNLHGVTPKAAREPGVMLIAFPRISFHIELKGSNDMDYRILDKPAFEVVAKCRTFTTELEKNFVELPQFWDEFKADTSWDTLMKFTEGKPGSITGVGSLGICTGKELEIIYAIGAEKGGKDAPKGFEVIRIPMATWAVFDSYGPVTSSIQAVIKKVFSEWFPSTGYEHAPVPELQVYFPAVNMSSPDYHCQLWIPIVKKNKK